MKAKPLSAMMAVTLGEIHSRCNGVIVRYQGGFWTYSGCPWNGSRPDWWVGSLTIQALVARGELEYSEWKEGRNHRFPIVARLPHHHEAEGMTA